MVSNNQLTLKCGRVLHPEGATLTTCSGRSDPFVILNTNSSNLFHFVTTSQYKLLERKEIRKFGKTRTESYGRSYYFN
jgi:hypothetical protein